MVIIWRKRERGKMKSILAKMYDDCLEHEIAIDMTAEKLEDMRLKAFKSGDIREFHLIIPVLNAIIEDAEKYKDFLIETLGVEEE